jgi:YidC/Oxa1 family membrane protein insertase
MKLQELLSVLLVTLLITLGLQMFLGYHYTTKDGTEHVGTEKMQVVSAIDPLSTKKLEREVDFLDGTVVREATVTIIETDGARYHFTDNGAIIERLEFKMDQTDSIFTTIHPFTGTIDKEAGAFLVAFNEKTPYFYRLIQNWSDGTSYRIIYGAETDDASIRKTFTLTKDTYQVDLNLVIEPKKATPIELRLLYPAPSLLDAPKTDIKSGLVNDRHDTIIVIQGKDELITPNFWRRPTFFGLQDRYFVHALVKDSQGFAQRGYFTKKDQQVCAIIEGPTVTEKSEWSMSFYCGPKQRIPMNMVDERLEQTLNYGYFAFIIKYIAQVMRYLLNLIFDYTKNYGLAIIVLTFLMKLILLPFTYKGEARMKESAQLQKRLQHLEVKYKGDHKALTEARAELIKKHGMPGLSGCLPLLVQIPIFLSLSWVLNNAIELYKAPFLWVVDLSIPDSYYLLPIAFGMSIMGQMFFSAADAKQNLSTFSLGMLLGAVSSNLPAGLTLYLFVSTLAGLLQTFIMKRVKL